MTEADPHRSAPAAATAGSTTSGVGTNAALLSLPILWLLLLLFSAGCSQPAEPNRGEASTSANANNSTNTVTRDEDHENDSGEPQAAMEFVTPLDRAAYDRFLEEHRGQVVLVDFWATWCTSCLEGFPETVKLHQRHHDEGLTVASLAINDEGDEPQVEEFLRSQSADFPHFRAAYRGAAAAMDAFEISNGTLPTLKVYDRTGTLRYTFGNGEPFDHSEIEVAVRQLLASR